jgi:hypothetical protein
MNQARRMFRYAVPVDDQPHGFPLTGGPVAVAAAGDLRSVEFWAEHDESRPARNRVFQVFGTGHDLPEGALWAGTCQRVSGLVWHLYELSAIAVAAAAERSAIGTGGAS